MREALGARRISLGPFGAAPLLPAGAALLEALRRARLQRRLRPGLEEAERALDAERVGLARVDQRSGRARGERVSRLVLVSRDGADRFHRALVRLVERHAPRVMVAAVDADGDALGRALFGRAKTVKLLLVDHRDAVADVLLAAARDARPGTSC